MNLSIQEKELAAELGFDEEVLLVVKANSQAEINKLCIETEIYAEDIDESTLASEFILKNYVSYSEREAKVIVNGLSVIVPEQKSKELVLQLRSKLATKGYMVFIVREIDEYYKTEIEYWGETVTVPAIKHERDEIGIIKGSNQFDIIVVQQTNGSNYEIYTRDVISKLKDWEHICHFEIIGASHEWMILAFVRLPEDIQSFAKDIYDFCPDILYQAILNPKKPLNKQTVEDLAEYIKREKRLYLRWD